jgi:hypothetical protein
MANALLVEFARQGIGVVDPRVGAVEGGIETATCAASGKALRAARTPNRYEALKIYGALEEIQKNRQGTQHHGATELKPYCIQKAER